MYTKTELKGSGIAMQDFESFLDMCDFVYTEEQISIAKCYIIQDETAKFVASKFNITLTAVMELSKDIVCTFDRYLENGLILPKKFRIPLRWFVAPLTSSLSGAVLTSSDRFNGDGSYVTDEALEALNWNFRRMGIPEVIYGLPEDDPFPLCDDFKDTESFTDKQVTDYLSACETSRNPVTGETIWSIPMVNVISAYFLEGTSKEDIRDTFGLSANFINGTISSFIEGLKFYQSSGLCFTPYTIKILSRCGLTSDISIFEGQVFSNIRERKLFGRYLTDKALVEINYALFRQKKDLVHYYITERELDARRNTGYHIFLPDTRVLIYQ